MKTYTKKDQVLIQEFLNGEQSSIEVLINRYKNKIFTYILLYVKHESLAEDIFQDTFIKVIKSLKAGKYQEKGIFVSWVMRIAHNLIIDHFRKAKHLRTYSSDDSDIDILNSKRFAEDNVEDEMVNTQIRDDIRELLNLLPNDQREVIVLRHYMNLSFKEIADHTDVSINTALGRMRYALINLRKLIKEKNLNLTLI